GRPTDRPLLAYVVETGDLLGVRWRPGSSGAATGILEWLPELVAFLREQGVEEITIRLDKGFPSKELVALLEELDVRFFLKMKNHKWVRRELGSWRTSKRADGIFGDAEAVVTNSGRLWGMRLLTLQGRRPLPEADETGDLLELDTWEVTNTCHILTNIPGIHALTAWRAYNRGALVEQRVKEMKQLSVGTTAVDDIDGNRLLWALGGLTYQLLHHLRRQLSGPARYMQPKTLRTRLFGGPAKFTDTGGQTEFQLPPSRGEDSLLLRLLEGLTGERDPPLALAA
ncbi:MAG: transposase, partial [Gemmatimonadota bacterium]